MTNAEPILVKRIPFSTIFIVSLVLLFSGIGIVIKNQLLVNQDIPFWATFYLSVVLFLSVASFGLPRRRRDGRLETMGKFESFLGLAFFAIPLFLLTASRNGIFSSVLLVVAIGIWTFEILIGTNAEEWDSFSTSAKWGEFLAVVWLVSGLLVTAGLSHYTYAVYPVSLLTSVWSFFDIRMIVSAVFAVYVIARALANTFSMDSPIVPRIPVPRIAFSTEEVDGLIGSIVLSFALVANIIFKALFKSLDAIWVIAARMAIFTWRLSASLVTQLRLIFLKRSFAEKMAYCVCMILVMYSAHVISRFSEQMVSYVQADLAVSDTHLLFPIAMSAISMCGIVTVFLCCMGFVHKPLHSAGFQLRMKVTYVTLIMTTFCVSGWLLTLVRLFDILRNLKLESPRFGAVTVSMSAIFVIVLAIYVPVHAISRRRA